MISEFQSMRSQGLNYQAYLPQGRFALLFTIVLEVKGQPWFEFERIMARKGAEIIVNLGDAMEGHFLKDVANIHLGEYTIKGNQLGVFDSYLPRSTHFFVIHFTSLGFRELIRFPLAKITNAQVQNLSEAGLPDLIEQLVEVGDFQRRVKLLQTWADRRIQDAQPDPLVSFIEKQLSQNPHYSSTKLEQLSGYSAKYLNKRFKAFTGYTISSFKRLSRFHQTLNRIQSGKDHSWADIFFELNYYDQSHFIKECKSFTGLSPAELKLKLEQPHFNLVF